MDTPFTRPSGTEQQFADLVHQLSGKFASNSCIQKLTSGTATLADYQNLLKMLFYQTYYGPSFFALAAVHCRHEDASLRDYFMIHAEEERTHWTWILNDLKATNYKGIDPRSEFPPVACQAYISFNYHVSVTYPVARLAIAAMLETLGAVVGSKHAPKICDVLKLNKSQVTFFLGHTETDVKHTNDIWKVLKNCNLSPADWGWMCHAAHTAYRLYFQMYEEAAR